MEEEAQVVLLDTPAAKVQPYRVPFLRRVWGLIRFALLRTWRALRRQHPIRWRDYRAVDDEDAQTKVMRRRSETAWMQRPDEEDLDAATLMIAKTLRKSLHQAVLRATKDYEKDTLKSQHEIFRLQMALAKAKHDAECESHE